MAESPTMEVRARLSAETAQFTRGMAQATQSVAQFQQSSNRLRGSMVAIGVASGAAGAAIIAFSKRAFSAAARVEELDIALQAVGHSTGIGYKALNDAALAIKANGIEMEIAQKSTLKYAQNNLELAKAAEVARVAQDLAVIGAMNSSDAFDRLTHAIITGRSEVLKSVGIQKSAGQAYAEYAASLGKTTKQLTYTEKQTAVMNMVLKEGARVAGTYEASMTTAGKVLRSFARINNELQVAVGGVLLKAFGPLIFETYETYKAFVKAITGGGAFKNTLTGIQQALVTLITPITDFVRGLKDKIVALNSAEKSVMGIAQSFQMLLPALSAAGAGFAAFAGKSLLHNLPILGNFFTRLKALPIALVAAALASAQFRNGLVKLFQAISPLIPPIAKLFTLLGKIAGVAIAVLGKALEALARGISGLIAFVQRNSQAFKILGYVIAAVGGGFLAFKATILAVSIAMKIQAAVMTAYSFVATALSGGIGLVTKAQRALNLAMAFNPIGLVIGAIVALTIAFAAAWKNSESFREVMTKVFNTVANIVGKVLGFIFRLFGNLLIAYGNLMDTNSTFGKVIATVYGFIWSTIGKVVSGVLEYIKFWLESFVSLMESNETLRKVIETTFNTIIRIFAFATTNIAVGIATILKAIATLIVAFEKVFEVAKGVFSKVVQVVYNFGKGVGSVFGKLASGIGDFLESTISTVKNWVTTLTNALRKIPIVRDAVDKVLSGFDSLTNFASTKLRNAGQAIEDFFVGSADSSTKSIDGISYTSKKLIEGAKGWGNYSEGAAGSLSSLANKMLDFQMKVVDFAAEDNGAKIVEALVGGAKKTIPVLENMIAKIKMAGELGVEFVMDKLSAGAFKAGEFLIGLADGIESFTEENFVAKLGDAFEGLTEKLKSALGFGNILEEEKKKLLEFNTKPGGADDALANGIKDQADLMKKIREAMADGIQSMKDVLQDLQDAAKDFADSLKETIVGFAGLKGVELPDGFIPKAKSLIENMKMRLDKSTQFAQQIAELQAMGLDANALKAIIEEGPIKGAQLAASILGGGMEAVKQVSELQKQIQFAGAAIGAYGSEAAFGDILRGASATVSDLQRAEFEMRSRGNNIVIEQGAFVVNVDTSGAADADEKADIITRKIQETFAILAKELAAK